MTSKLLRGLNVMTLATLAACAAPAPTPTPTQALQNPTVDSLTTAAAAITPDLILGHIKVLASDEFAGRLPGTPGEDKSVAYITQQFEAMKLAPGNPNGGYVQNVPLVGIDSKSTMQMSAGGKSIKLDVGHDFVAVSAHAVPEVKIRNAPMVFVGYGVQAPEYGWDDYKGLDVKGKTIVMLINDPAVTDPHDPTQLDPKMFKGSAMTYYGRWTYKYEIASKLGAAAAIIVHETKPAAYPWAVVENSWSGEQFSLAAEDKNLSTVPVKAWITLDKAHELFKDAGLDFDTLKQQALSRDFKPVPLNAKASFTIDNKVRKVQSHNVIAKLEGSDPTLKNQYIVYTAHWDHLGRDTSLPGDQIFNGAADNASGVAGLLAIAKAYTALPTPPKRSVLFMSVTAEEQGLLGSKYYATHPLYPLTRTLADFNMDVLNTYGATRDVQVIGAGQNTIEDTLSQVAARRDRVIVADSEPEKGYYYRSDQFEFAKLGLPSIYLKRGVDVIGKPAGYGKQQLDNYTANDYHKPSDEVKDSWNLSGAVADTQLLFETGDVIADGTVWPTWKDGSEFKAIREQSLQPH